jgi:hypothetical protein
MIGVGVGVGFGGVGLGPSWVSSQLASVYGAELIGLWVGDDIAVDGSNLITGWPARIGNALANSTANRFGVTTVNGRRGTAPGANEFKSLEAALSATGVHYFAIVNGAAVAVDYERVIDCRIGGGGQFIRQLAGVIYTATGWSHAIDNTATESYTEMVSGLHLIASAKAASDAAGIAIGGQSNDSRVFSGNLMMVGVLSAAPSAGQNASMLALAKRYYRF